MIELLNRTYNENLQRLDQSAMSTMLKMTASSPTYNPNVTANCVRLLYQTTPALIANGFCALMLVLASLKTVPGLSLSIWFVAVLGIGAARYALKRNFSAREILPENARRWGLYYTMGSGLSGLAWGVAVLIVLQTESVLLLTVVTVLVAGLIAGSATTGSSFLPAFYAFMVPPTVCLTAIFFSAQQPEYFALGGGIVLSSGLLSIITWRMHQTLANSFTLTMKNGALVRDLQTALEEVETANSAKSDFLANMSHELRTPLNAIIGFSSMIREQTFGPVGNPKYIEYLRDIDESGTHLLEILNDILDVSKIEAGKGELHERNVDLLAVIKSCLTLVKARARAGDVELVQDIAPNPPVLFADEVRLKQIVTNLLSNAIKFTPAGGKVTTTVRWNFEDGYVIQIVDTGIGISRADIPKVLAPFHQINSCPGGKREGTGLGLSLSKSLAELHGGSLDLKSDVNVGTVATVRLPANRIVLGVAAPSDVA